MAKRTTKRKPTGEVPQSMSLRAFARLLGVSDMAVRKAVARQRLFESVGRTPDGQPCIRDVELAKQEWAANAAKAQRGKKTTLTEVQRLIGLQRERQLKLANEQRVGKLVAIEMVTREAFDAARIIREGMLNIPARLSAELAAESDAGRVYARLDAAIREALASTADELKAAG